jgi:hypothetical protein
MVVVVNGGIVVVAEVVGSGSIQKCDVLRKFNMIMCIGL